MRKTSARRACTPLRRCAGALSHKGQCPHHPLHVAAWNGCSGAVQVLIDAKASIDVRDSEGNTPMHLASQSQ